MKEGRLLTLLVAPLISEKSTELADTQKRFVFRVVKDATKSEIKAAIETLFNVKVRYVQVLNVKGKTKKRQRTGIGKRADWKKAYVRLMPGHDIDFMATE